MTFGAAVAKCFRDTLNFEARAPRSEYWWFFLFCFAGNIAAGAADVMAFGWEHDSLSFFEPAFWLAMLLTVIAVTVRRLHDLDRTGWWVLLGVPHFLLGVFSIDWEGPGPASHWDRDAEALFFAAFIVSVICLIILLILMLRKGTDGENRFGPNPLAGGGGKP